MELKDEFNDILRDIIRDVITETEHYLISKKDLEYWVNWLFANYDIKEKVKS